MLFSSTVFLFAFLPLCLVLHFACGKRARNVVLLVASLFFYAWGESFLVALMLLSIGANWAFGLRVAGARSERERKRAVALAVVFDVGLLVIFKYANWLWANVAALLAPGADPLPLGRLLFARGGLGEAIFGDENGGIRLPIGISFFTFQALSYVIDVYRREVEAERRPLDFAVYIALFPQLVAGPIVRYRDIAAELAARTIDLPLFASGVRRFVVGLGKKLLIANVVAGPADAIFDAPPGDLAAPVAWLGVLCYGLQIYFDFSGYSDMAIGLGRMLGFRFLENFAHPYVATSITEFWRRWHISLSSWFRDYLYVPLGGNRGGPLRTYRNLVLVFLLCGLWHGASWAFVVWGLFHGVFLVVERLGFLRLLVRLPRVLRHAYVLLAVGIGWVFFRSPDVVHAGSFLRALAGASEARELLRIDLLVDAEIGLALAAGVIGSLPWLPRLERALAARGPVPRLAGEAFALASLAAILGLCGMQLAAGTYDPFIYFRF